MTAAVPDSWTELCLIGIKRESDSSEVQFAGVTEDISGMDFGEKEVEGKTLVNGGRVVQKTPMTDESITLKVYPVSADLDGTGVMQHMHPQSSDDTTNPIAVLNSNLREKHRVVIVWSTTLPATAEAATTLGEPAYRITISNAYCTKVVPGFDDKIVSAEVTFKWTPFTKAAVANKLEESTDHTVALAEVSASPTSITG